MQGFSEFYDLKLPGEPAEYGRAWTLPDVRRKVRLPADNSKHSHYWRTDKNISCHYFTEFRRPPQIMVYLV